LKVFTLYIGTTRPGAKDAIVRIINQRFPSFTVISGEGRFQGKTEPMWFVRIATNHPLDVLATASEIRSTLQQETVGIEYESRYYLCSEEDAASALRTLLLSQRH
jgi:hypothetical protein